MTQDEKDRCVGRMMRERKELKGEIVIIQQRAQEMTARLSFVADALKSDSFYTEKDQQLLVCRSVGSGECVAFPERDEIIRVFDELKQAIDKETKIRNYDEKLSTFD